MSQLSSSLFRNRIRSLTVSEINQTVVSTEVFHLKSYIPLADLEQSSDIVPLELEDAKLPLYQVAV